MAKTSLHWVCGNAYYLRKFAVRAFLQNNKTYFKPDREKSFLTTFFQKSRSLAKTSLHWVCCNAYYLRKNAVRPFLQNNKTYFKPDREKSFLPTFFQKSRSLAKTSLHWLCCNAYYLRKNAVRSLSKTTNLTSNLLYNYSTQLFNICVKSLSAISQKQKLFMPIPNKTPAFLKARVLFFIRKNFSPYFFVKK